MCVCMYMCAYICMYVYVYKNSLSAFSYVWILSPLEYYIQVLKLTVKKASLLKNRYLDLKFSQQLSFADKEKGKKDL